VTYELQVKIAREFKQAFGRSPGAREALEWARTHPKSVAYRALFIDITDAELADTGRMKLVNDILNIRVKIQTTKLDALPRGIEYTTLTTYLPISKQRVFMGESEALTQRFEIMEQDIEYIESYVTRLREQAASCGLSHVVEPHCAELRQNLNSLRIDLRREASAEGSVSKVG